MNVTLPALAVSVASALAPVAAHAWPAVRRAPVVVAQPTYAQPVYAGGYGYGQQRPVYVRHGEERGEWGRRPHDEWGWRDRGGRGFEAHGRHERGWR